MEELVDVINPETGKKTGEIITKKEAHQKGIWHSSIHIWLISKDHKKILLQKRCPEKNLFPNMWDISVGGHISSGEEPINAAKRELSEELGLNPEEYNFIYQTTLKEKFVDHDILSNEIVYVYLINTDLDLNKLTLQKEEVSEVKWYTKQELQSLNNNQKVIPHLEEFNIIYNLLK